MYMYVKDINYLSDDMSDRMKKRGKRKPTNLNQE